MIVFVIFSVSDCFNKTIEKAKNRVKSDLEVTIKAIDSKHMEIFSAIESTDSKRKKMEFAAQHICDGLNPYGNWSGLVVGLMGASWMLAELTNVRERSGELRHSYP